LLIVLNAQLHLEQLTITDVESDDNRDYTKSQIVINRHVEL